MCALYFQYIIISITIEQSDMGFFSETLFSRYTKESKRLHDGGMTLPLFRQHLQLQFFKR